MRQKKKLYPRYAYYIVTDLTISSNYITFSNKPLENRITSFHTFNSAKNQLLNNITKHKKSLSMFRNYVLSLKQNQVK